MEVLVVCTVALRGHNIVPVWKASRRTLLALIENLEREGATPAETAMADGRSRPLAPG